MEDSNRTRRRITAFIVSSGGRISSGQNDNFLAWVFRILYRGDYAHERVGFLKDTLLAMEADGELTLERSSVGRIIGASLPEGTTIEVIDEEDHDLFDMQSIWLYVARLSAERKRLLQELSGADEALMQLSTELPYVQANEHLRARVAELESQLAATETCTHEQQIAQLQDDHATHIAHTRDEYQQLLDESKDKLASYRKKMQKRLSSKGEEIVQLRRELREVKQLHVMLGVT